MARSVTTVAVSPPVKTPVGSAMTPNQYRSALKKLGLSQIGAGRFLGVDPRQSRRWAAGDAPIPHAVALLLRLMLKLGLSAEDVDGK